jgi:hypothetical protein
LLIKPFGNRLRFNPKISEEFSPTPQCVGYTLPKIGKNGNVNELFCWHNLGRIREALIKKGLA